MIFKYDRKTTKKLLENEISKLNTATNFTMDFIGFL